MRTRRRSSSRIGSSSRSPAAAIPPPMHDPLGRDDRDHVGDPDPEISTDLGERRRSRRASPARARAIASSAVAVPHAAAIWSARANASRQPRLPQPHHGPVGLDRLVADLAGRAVVSLVDPAVDRDHATDPGPQREPDHRRGAPRPAPSRSSASPNARASLIRNAGQAKRVTDRTRDRLAGPRAGQVDQEPRRAGRRVVQPRARRCPTVWTPGQRAIASRAHLREPRHHASGPCRRPASRPGRGPARAIRRHRARRRPT